MVGVGRINVKLVVSVKILVKLGRKEKNLTSVFQWFCFVDSTKAVLGCVIQKLGLEILPDLRWKIETIVNHWVWGCHFSSGLEFWNYIVVVVCCERKIELLVLKLIRVECDEVYTLAVTNAIRWLHVLCFCTYDDWSCWHFFSSSIF